MIPTEGWMRTNFAFFNKKFFDDMIPTPRLTVSSECHNSDGECYGYYNLKARYDKKTRNIGYVMGNGNICLSTRYDMSEKNWQSVLLHEMIHAYINLCLRTYPEDLHGALFNNIAKEMVDEGYNVLNLENVNGNPENKNNPNQENRQNTNRILCLITKPQGENYKFWCCVCDMNEASKYYYTASRINGVGSISFYRCNSRNLSKFTSDMSKLNGFGGMTIDEVSNKMSQYFNEGKEVFDFSKMEKL